MASTKTCAVFGGSKGIGAAIAKLLFQDGFKVAVISRNKTNVDTFLHRLGSKSSSEAFGVQCDVTSEQEVVRAFADIETALGSVNVLVNAAGINQDKLLVKSTSTDIRQLLDVNLVGSMTTSKICLKHMMKNKDKNGCIINIGSVVGSKGNAGQCAYSASKAGLIGFTKSLAKEVGSRNIRVNCISPGYIETEMTAKLPHRDLLMHQIPLGRMGDPSEVAQLARFLIDSMYITGQSIIIDGGLQMNS